MMVSPVIVLSAIFVLSWPSPLKKLTRDLEILDSKRESLRLILCGGGCDVTRNSVRMRNFGKNFEQESL